jgi:hypothetical protein
MFFSDRKLTQNSHQYCPSALFLHILTNRSFLLVACLSGPDQRFVCLLWGNIYSPHKDVWTFKLLSSIFTVSKVCTQPRCLLTSDWVKNFWYIWKRILFTPQKGYLASYHNMNETRKFYANWNKSDTESK